MKPAPEDTLTQAEIDFGLRWLRQRDLSAKTGAILEGHAGSFVNRLIWLHKDCFSWETTLDYSGDGVIGPGIMASGMREGDVR